MASVLHGSARTTPRIRAELQTAQASSRALAAQYGFNPKTVLKWRNREGTADAAMGPKPRSTTLTEAEQAIIVEFSGAAPSCRSMTSGVPLGTATKARLIVDAAKEVSQPNRPCCRWAWQDIGRGLPAIRADQPCSTSPPLYTR